MIEVSLRLIERDVINIAENLFALRHEMNSKLNEMPFPKVLAKDLVYI